MSEKPTTAAERVPLLDELAKPISVEVPLVKETLENRFFKPLRAGDPMPKFELPDFDGNRVRSADLLERGMLVISFNRGNLCAFCRMEVNTWEAYLNDLAYFDATFVSITGDRTWAETYSESKDISNFQLLFDKGFDLAERFGLSYHLNESYLNAFESFGVQISDFYGEDIARDQQKLPVPATYVVDRNGTIVYAFIEPDFTKRAEPYEVIRVIMDHLKTESE